jgi:hypothetical protein
MTRTASQKRPCQQTARIGRVLHRLEMDFEPRLSLIQGIWREHQLQDSRQGPSEEAEAHPMYQIVLPLQKVNQVIMDRPAHFMMMLLEIEQCCKVCLPCQRSRLSGSKRA